MSEGQVHDSEYTVELLSNAKVCIPDKANSLTKHGFYHELYKARNVVERFFLRIKNRRNTSTRYNKLALMIKL